VMRVDEFRDLVLLPPADLLDHGLLLQMRSLLFGQRV
jgi:hypothetical protein